MRRLVVEIVAIVAFCASGLAQIPVLRTVHVFVALADNDHQGIVPVARILGNGEDAQHNLYWGSAYGVKTFFSRSADWQLLFCKQKPKAEILERCAFKHRSSETYLIADAYRGLEIRQAILDFFDSAAGDGIEQMVLSVKPPQLEIPIRGGANLVAYIGHDGLMDFQIARYPMQKNASRRDAIVLACASKQYFASGIRASGASPLLWTTNLMAPEAYTLKGALDGWIRGESADQIRERAAAAYDKFQKCGIRAARRLLVSGW